MTKDEFLDQLKVWDAEVLFEQNQAIERVRFLCEKELKSYEGKYPLADDFDLGIIITCKKILKALDGEQ